MSLLRSRQTLPETPLAALMACHQRIREHVAALQALAQLEDLEDPRGPATARRTERYLREGLPLHAQDEDLSLLPRVRDRVSSTQLAALQRMNREHTAVQDGGAHAVAALQAYLAGAPDRGALQQAAYWAEHVLLAHIVTEEADVLGVCALLDAEESRAFLEELRARRT